MEGGSTVCATTGRRLNARWRQAVMVLSAFTSSPTPGSGPVRSQCAHRAVPTTHTPRGAPHGLEAMPSLGATPLRVGFIASLWMRGISARGDRMVAGHVAAREGIERAFDGRPFGRMSAVIPYPTDGGGASLNESRVIYSDLATGGRCNADPGGILCHWKRDSFST